MRQHLRAGILAATLSPIRIRPPLATAEAFLFRPSAPPVAGHRVMVRPAREAKRRRAAMTGVEYLTAARRSAFLLVKARRHFDFS